MYNELYKIALKHKSTINWLNDLGLIREGIYISEYIPEEDYHKIDDIRCEMLSSVEYSDYGECIPKRLGFQCGGYGCLVCYMRVLLSILNTWGVEYVR